MPDPTRVTPSAPASPPFSAARSGDSLTLRIEDEDGFATEWEWPEGRSLLGHGDFIGLFEAQHDAMRAAALPGSSSQEAPRA